ncbi:histidine kinase [Flavobacterium sp. LM5]|nr:histidine kinase [Flavobacterium sp. LM5]
MFKTQKTHHFLFLRVLLLFCGVVLSFFLFSKNLIYSCFLSSLLSFLLLIELFFFLKNTMQFYDRIISLILNNDFTSDFSKLSTNANYTAIYQLYEKLKNKENDTFSKDIVYSSILNNIESGILILEKNESDWNIFLMNNYFSKHFMAPKVTKWHYLKTLLPSLCEFIEDQEFKEMKSPIQIQVDKKETQTFVIQTSVTKTLNKEYYVILLDSIQKVVDKKEKEAWINLMKVISHELLNSLTPIRSLSQNLHELIQQDSLSNEDLEDIKQSVITMHNRSNHLQEFVESYRILAMLPTPKKEKAELSKLINDALQIMLPLFKKENITVNNSLNQTLWILIDKNQIDQVFINLLTNCMYALEKKEDKQINISVERHEQRLYIIIADNGNGIEPEIQDKIFLPFFTTRKKGAGIGLTLSKSIIEAHGGYLSFESEENKTQFKICLLV